jgi:hypothetical protein
MKKLLLSLVALFCISFSVEAQSKAPKGLDLTPRDTLMFQYMDTYVSQLREPKYQLFKTENMWTFLKLNTVTGQIWQVQYTVDGPEYRFETPLDTTPRISEYFDEAICGRFTLYPTQNTFNFILLDQIDGRCWQVQWNIEPSKRFVTRIY